MIIHKKYAKCLCLVEIIKRKRARYLDFLIIIACFVNKNILLQKIKNKIFF